MKTIQETIIAQYRASLAMFRDAMDKCPESLWTDEQYKPGFWRIAYHTVFFTDLYLSEHFNSFVPWDKHIDEYESIGPMEHKGGKMPKDGPAYAKDDVLDYCDIVEGRAEQTVNALDLDAESGFFWLPLQKLELQFYNIRHIHHHAGQLSMLLRVETGQETEWVGTK